MKRAGIFLLALVFVFSAFSSYACELYWYLAASMSKPGREVVEKYNQNADCHVFLVVGGSGQLLSQLHLAGKGDMYTPASGAFLEKAKAMNIVRDYRLLLQQTPVFGISKTKASAIKTFDHILQPGLRIALGNPKTMALGKTYQGIEEKMPGDIKKKIRQSTVLEAININQIVNYVSSGAVDTGIMFDTTATANRIPFVYIPEEYNVKNRAYLVELVYSDKSEEVRKLQEFIFKQDAVFEKYGFQLSHSDL